VEYALITRTALLSGHMDSSHRSGLAGIHDGATSLKKCIFMESVASGPQTFPGAVYAIALR